MPKEVPVNPFNSPLVPILLSDKDTLEFRCHKGIACYNACCKQADITLAPYDVIRLKKRLGMTSTEFLKQYTVPFEMDAHGMPGIKMKTQNDQPVCLMMNEDGCSVYTDRPSACRYYPVGLMAMRAQNSPDDQKHYFLVKEEHCHGHNAGGKSQTIAEYRAEQGVADYDDANRDWYQIILKKRSSGMTVGAPSATSFHLFFMASFDIDRFREFVTASNFRKLYILDDAEFDSIIADDYALMRFGFRFLKQVFYGEMTIPTNKDAVAKRFEERKDIFEARRQAEIAADKDNDDKYGDLD